VTLLNWPGWSQVKPGLDISWQAGLALAFTRHLQWGPALVFPYGPYGFAGSLEPFYRDTALIAVGYVFAVTWLLAGLLVAALRRHWGLAAAGFVAWGVIAVSRAPVRAADFGSAVALGLGLAILQARDRGRRFALAVGLGALAGFELLVKSNDGVVVVGVLVLAVGGASGSRHERAVTIGQAAAAAAATFLVSWSAAGQSLANIPSFIRGSVSLAVGYSSAMGGSLRSGRIAWYAVAAAGILVLAFTPSFRDRPARWRAAATLMLAGWCWAVTKDGFVGGNHFLGFFRIMLAAVALSGVVRPARPLYIVSLVLAGLVTVIAAHPPPPNPVASVRSFVSQIADIAQPGRFSQLTTSARERLIKEERLSPGILALIRGRSVAIEPWEDIVAWGDPGARWDPEPVVQAYSAYTPYLDGADASFVASRSAPARILYTKGSFDARDPFMDPPATAEAIYCHYAQIALSPDWQVLGRVPDRCGPAVRIGEARTHFGQPVSVPSARGKMVVASFTFAAPFAYKVESLLLKPSNTYLTTWSGHAAPITYRFVAGTAQDAHVLKVPAALGYAAGFTPPPVRALELSGGGWPTGKGPITVVFSAVAMARS
jgi:hypothetical protein